MQNAFYQPRILAAIWTRTIVIAWLSVDGNSGFSRTASGRRPSIIQLTTIVSRKRGSFLWLRNALIKSFNAGKGERGDARLSRFENRGRDGFQTILFNCIISSFYIFIFWNNSSRTRIRIILRLIGILIVIRVFFIKARVRNSRKIAIS